MSKVFIYTNSLDYYFTDSEPEGVYFYRKNSRYYLDINSSSNSSFFITKSVIDTYSISDITQQIYVPKNKYILLNTYQLIRLYNKIANTKCVSNLLYYEGPILLNLINIALYS